MGFQGKHKDRKRINYKAKGDSFQCNALVQEGYTYQFFMRNDPAPAQYSKYSPLFGRVFALFDTLKDKHHNAGFDNLYNAAWFAQAAYLITQRKCCVME